MNLTHEYRTIRAIFEKPESGPINYEDPDDIEAFKTYFTVTPIVYYITLNKFGGNCIVNFGYHGMVGTTDFLTEYFSRIFKRKITDIELARLKDRFESMPTGVLKLGNAGKVFGNVLAIVADFIGKYEVSCLRFSAAKESRIDLYRAMIRKFLPDWKLEEEPVSGMTRFIVCKSDETYEEKKLKYPMSL